MSSGRLTIGPHKTLTQIKTGRLDVNIGSELRGRLTTTTIINDRLSRIIVFYENKFTVVARNQCRLSAKRKVEGLSITLPQNAVLVTGELKQEFRRLGTGGPESLLAVFHPTSPIARSVEGRLTTLQRMLSAGWMAGNNLLHPR